MQIVKNISLLALLLLAVAVGTVSAQAVKSKPQIEQATNAIVWTVSSNTVRVENVSPGQQLEVFSVVGVKMEEFAIKSTTAEFTLTVPKGYYILKIGENVRKVVIK